MKKTTVLLILITLGLVVSGVVFAQEEPVDVVRIGGFDDVPATDIAGNINNFYKTAVALGGIAAVAVIVIGGLMYATSGAIDKKNQGKDLITSAIWGLVLLLGAFVVLNTINPELTNLQNPEGVGGISGFEGGNLVVGSIGDPYSCTNNPDMEPCAGEIATSTEASCCNEKKSDVCSEELMNFCSPEVFSTSSRPDLQGSPYYTLRVPNCDDEDCIDAGEIRTMNGSYHIRFTGYYARKPYCLPDADGSALDEGCYVHHSYRMDKKKWVKSNARTEDLLLCE